MFIPLLSVEFLNSTHGLDAGHLRSNLLVSRIVIPTQAGIQFPGLIWFPACAGMTKQSPPDRHHGWQSVF